METISWFSPILNILAILCITIGLYIAGRFLPTLITWTHVQYPNNALSGWFRKIILWLALGTLFTAPLLDGVSSLGVLVNVILAQPGTSEFPTLLGTVSSRVYFLFPLLLMIVVYSITIYLGIGFITSSRQFHQTERTFIVLAVASLVFGVINSVFTQVLSFQVPFLKVQQNYGLSGYLFEVLVGIVLLFGLLIGLNRLLSNHPASR
jgi:hypothetical protein